MRSLRRSVIICFQYSKSELNIKRIRCVKLFSFTCIIYASSNFYVVFEQLTAKMILDLIFLFRCHPFIFQLVHLCINLLVHSFLPSFNIHPFLCSLLLECSFAHGCTKFIVATSSDKIMNLSRVNLSKTELAYYLSTQDCLN